MAALGLQQIVNSFRRPAGKFRICRPKGIRCLCPYHFPQLRRGLPPCLGTFLPGELFQQLRAGRCLLGTSPSLRIILHVGEYLFMDAIPERVMRHANMLSFPLDICHGRLHLRVSRTLCLMLGCLKDAVSLTLPPVIPDRHTRNGGTHVHKRSRFLVGCLRRSGPLLHAGGDVLTWRLHRRRFRRGDNRGCHGLLCRHDRRYCRISNLWRWLSLWRNGRRSGHTQSLGRSRYIGTGHRLDIGELRLCGQRRGHAGYCGKGSPLQSGVRQGTVLGTSRRGSIHSPHVRRGGHRHISGIFPLHRQGRLPKGIQKARMPGRSKQVNRLPALQRQLHTALRRRAVRQKLFLPRKPFRLLDASHKVFGIAGRCGVGKRISGNGRHPAPHRLFPPQAGIDLFRTGGRYGAKSGVRGAHNNGSFRQGKPRPSGQSHRLSGSAGGLFIRLHLCDVILFLSNLLAAIAPGQHIQPLLAAGHKRCLPKRGRRHLSQRLQEPRSLVPQAKIGLNGPLSHLRGGLGGQLLAVQTGHAPGGLAHAVRKQPFAKRPQQPGHEKIAQGFRPGFPQTILRCLAVKLLGNPVPFLLCRRSAQQSGSFGQHVLHEVLLAGPIGHRPGSRHAGSSSDHRPGNHPCRYAGAQTGPHGRQTVGHGDHGIRYAVKGLSRVFLRIGGLFPGARLPLPQCLGVRHVNLATAPRVAHRVHHTAGQHGQPFANGKGRVSQT